MSGEGEVSAEVGTEVEAVAATLGTVFTSFPHHDSGCRAYGVAAGGRAGAVLLDAGDLGEAFRGTPAMAAVLADATRPEPGDRVQTVAELAWRWREAVGR